MEGKPVSDQEIREAISKTPISVLDNLIGEYIHDSRNQDYARGRGRNAARDSMGRYSSRGYSRDANEDFRAEVEELMQKAPDEHARAKLQSMLQSM